MKRTVWCMERFVFIITIIVLILFSIGRSQQSIIAPGHDVHIFTFGGGQGANAYIKYNITSVPVSVVIDSVFITPFVHTIGPSWDGDMDFWNVNEQGWTESDSAEYLWGLPTSDSIHQAGGFGTAVGWAQSVDIKNIFLTDYNASNTYCSIKMKDPDDVTFNPMPGSPSIDLDDTLAIGNILFDQYIVCYPHEYPNAPPWLLVYYHSVGLGEERSESAKSTLSVHPNPFSRATRISLIVPQPYEFEEVIVTIFSATGRVVREFCVEAEAFDGGFSIVWSGKDKTSCRVPAGVYIIRVEAGGYEKTEKVILLK